MSSQRVGDAFVGLNATVSRGQSPTGFNFWSLGPPSTNLIVTFRLDTLQVNSSLSRYINTWAYAISTRRFFPFNFHCLNDGGRTAHGRLMLVGGEHVCDVDDNMGSRDSSSQTKNQIRRSIITFEERPQTRERNRQCASVHSFLGGGNPSDI